MGVINPFDPGEARHFMSSEISDPELERWAATEVMGWFWSEEWQSWFVKGEPYGCWPDELLPEEDIDEETPQPKFHPLTNLDHAFMVVEKMRVREVEHKYLNNLDIQFLEHQYRVTLKIYCNAPEFFPYGQNKAYNACHKNLGHAILLACRRALEGE